MRRMDQRSTLALVIAALFAWAGAAWAEPVAIVNANVIPMDTERVLSAQTVVTDEGRIVALGPSANVVVPSGAMVIDAADAYLMPGLNDMHTHLELRDSDPRSLLLYLAEGTTSVRSTSGWNLNRDWRDAINRGELLGPSILTAGNVLFGLVDNTSGLNQYVQGFRIVATY